MLNRKELDNIIESNKEENWWKPDLFKNKVLNLLPKELEIIELPPEEDKNYNCFIYTLGLNDDKEIIFGTKGFIYSNFFKKLIRENILEETKDPKEGDYIIYENLKDYPGEITHSGILDKNGMIISKWAWGPIIKHKIFDVPESYGNKITYFKKLDKDEVIKLFNQLKDCNSKK